MVVVVLAVRADVGRAVEALASVVFAVELVVVVATATEVVVVGTICCLTTAAE